MEELSKLQKQRRGTYKYNHRMGKKSYVGLKAELLKPKVQSNVKHRGFNPLSSFGKEKACNLAINTRDNIVATGVMFERTGSNEMIHNVRLGDSNVRVSIKKIFSPNTPLPIPVPSEMEIMKDALGSIVAWPKEFVIMDFQRNNDDGIKNNAKYDDQEHTLKKQYDGCATVDFFGNPLNNLNIDGISIPMNCEMFGEDAAECFVFRKDLLEFCAMEPLEVTCMVAYMRYLYDKHESSQRMFNFINPASLSDASIGHVSRYITNRLRNSKRNQVSFIPFNLKQMFHWVLIVIDLSSLNCYWMDSKNSKPAEVLKFYINTGLASLYIDGKKMPTPTWIFPMCPRQQGGFECGYFVMRFMKELIEDSSCSIDNKIMMLSEKETYTSDDINEVRSELIEFVAAYIPH